MNLINCQIVYDTDHKGCAELLGYYYFHLMKPFQIAIILHDSVFIQQRVEFITEVEKTKTFQSLWTFPNHWDHELESYYIELCKDMPMYGDIIRYYHSNNWQGCYGIMSVIHSDFMTTLDQYGLFTIMDKIQERRDARSAIERIMGFLTYYVGLVLPSMFGEIHSYTTWGTTFTEYLTKPHDLPIVKVWTGR
jgi:hypothetical protein